MFSQDDCLLSLSYLLGERSVPTAEATPRRDFIQSTLVEAYQAYPWRFATRSTSIPLASGLATLPTTVDISHELNAKYSLGSNDVSLYPIDIDDSPLAFDGSQQYWLTVDSDTSPYVLHTKETTPSSVIVKYQSLPPSINATVVTPYPSKNTIALGARRYVKLAQNPDADISQDEALFQKRLTADISAQQIGAPRKKRASRQSVHGSRTGDF